MFDSRIPEVRRFNRAVSQTIGALNDRYLGRYRTLGEARVLFEIGADGVDVKALRARLGLDSGYLSRLLRALERQGLTKVAPASHDKRARRASLTRAGLAELKKLDRLSDDLAQSILAPLTEAQRAQLVTAMADVERLLSAASVTVDLESPASDDAQYCLGQYFEELSRRFEGGFDPARSLPIDEAEIKPPHGAFLVMRLQGRPVGCGAFKRLDQDAAYLKRMWIADEARGLGLGRRLLKELEDRAGSYGYRTAKLETNKSLTQAIRLYHRSGYREVPPFNDEPFAHHWFEKPLG